MASVTPNVAQVFPVGTTVGAYPASGWPATALPPSGAAVPSATESQTVGSDGTLTFTTLAAGTTYFLGASVSGTWKYMRLVTPGGTASPRGSASDPLSTTDDTELPAAAALADGAANPTAPTVGAAGLVWNGTTWDRAKETSANGASFASAGVAAVAGTVNNGSGNQSPLAMLTLVPDGWSPTGTHAIGPLAYIGGGLWDRVRTPNVFKSFASTAITAGTGATIWTPAGGKKFRVMGLAISSSAAGVLILGDNAVGTVIARTPAVAAAGIATLGNADLGNGILSAAANNVLKLDGPTGNVAGMVWGIEE